MNCLILAVNPIVNDSRILRIAGFFSKTSGPDQIDVLGLGDEPGDFSHWPARVSVATRPSLINVPAVLRWLLSSLAYLLLVLQTSFALRGRSGIVWSADADSILYGWLVSRLLGWKFIYDAHEFWPAESKRRRGSSILLLSERWLIKQAHAVVTVSQGMAESYQNFYSLDRRPLVIYNTPEVRSSESMKLALNFKTEHVFTLLYQGHLVEDRQILPFIKAFRSRRRTQPMRLAFLGHGPLFEQLLALQDDDLVVHQSVNPDQLLNITRTASAGLVLLDPQNLNHRLTLCNKLFEYIQAGLPVLATDCAPEMLSILDKYEIGVGFEDYTPTSVHSALDRLQLLLNHPEGCSPSMAVAQADYSWELQELKLKSLLRP